MSNTRLKDIPQLSRDLSNLPAVMESVREALQVFRGFRGDAEDRALTLRDLDESIRRVVLSGGTLTTGSSTTNIIGGGGTGGGGVTPDPTPPPTATGLTLTAGLSSIFVSCDVPVYTQGHGHDITVVYGAKWATGDPTPPTFSEAVELFRFQGPFGAYPSDLNVRWCVWIKWRSNDGYLSTDPAGGTNGVQATTGLIGTADLGAGIVLAGNLASGAVTPAAFSSGTLPVFFAATLPTLPNALYPAGAILINTTNLKLYRSSGTAWTTAADGADIVAGTIVAGQVAAGGLAAGTITVGSAAIENLAVRTALIDNAAITNVKVSDMAVDKLTGSAMRVGAYIQSTNFVSGVSGFRIDANGVAEFQQGTFRGALQAATGTFNGDVSGASGIFSGGVRGGAITSYAWPATGVGYYLASGGLLMGNYNDYVANPLSGIGYLQLDAATGDIHSPSLNITGGVLTFNGSGIFTGTLNAPTINAGTMNGTTGTFSGTLTALAVDAVDTVNIAGQAVTFPVAVYSGAQYTTADNTTEVTLLTASITTSGAPVLVFSGLEAFLNTTSGATNTVTFRIRRDGAEIASIQISAIGTGGGNPARPYVGTPTFPPIKDAPSAAAHTYTLTYQRNSSLSTTNAGFDSYGLMVIEVKK